MSAPLRVVHVIGPGVGPLRWPLLQALRAAPRADLDPCVLCCGRYEGPRARLGDLLRLPGLPLASRLGLRSLAERLGPLRHAVLHVWSPAGLEPAIRLRDRARRLGDGPAGIIVDVDAWRTAPYLARQACEHGGLVFVVHSRSEQGTLLRAGVPARLCTRIPDPVFPQDVTVARREDVRRRLRLEAKDEVVLVLPPVTRQAGALYAAWSTLLVQKVRPRVRFVLPDWGREARRVVRLVESCGMRDVLRHAGQRFDLSDLLAAADVAIHTPLRSGPVGGVVRAAAAGVPLVGSDVAALREVLPAAATAHLVPPRHPREAARELLGILDEPDAARREAVTMRATMRRGRSIEAALKQYVDLYRRVRDGKAAMNPNLRGARAARRARTPGGRRTDIIPTNQLSAESCQSPGSVPQTSARRSRT